MTNNEALLMRSVQGILVRNYVDTQKLDVDVTGTSVYIAGELRVFESHPSNRKKDPTEQVLGIKNTLLHIERQVRGLGDVSHLEVKLRNWERVGNQWIPSRSASSLS